MTRKTLFLSLLFSFLFSSAGFLNIAEAFKLPDTGQTKCYNSSGTEISCAGTGQDGEVGTINFYAVLGCYIVYFFYQTI